MDIFERLEKRKVQKGDILLRQGDICKNVFRVVSGCLKSYIIDKTGKEHILQFAPENWVISDLKSGIDRVPSTLIIEAIENSEIQLLPFEEITNFQSASKEELILSNKALIRNIIASNQRIQFLLSSTAEERYLNFIDTYPTLFQRLPLKLIASFLGMAPEYLSDIRRKLSKK